jgi:curved DNA-binding protein CbpA
MSNTLSGDKIDELVGTIYTGIRKNQKTDKKKQQEINIDDIDFEKLKGTDRKVHADLVSGMIDYYAIIGVKDTDTNDYIKKKCNDKMAKYHPSKHNILLKNVPPSQREEEKARLMDQFDLIRQAYNVLKDSESRKYYDLQKKTMESKNFVKQKSDFEEFKKMQESEINEASRKNAENNFKMSFLEMDKKHGFKRSELDEEPMTTENFNRKLQDISLSREAFNEELRMNQVNMFEGRSFNPIDFNKAWEKKKLKDQRKAKSNKHDTSISLWNGLSAANDFGIGGSTDYVSVNNYGDLYADNNFSHSQFSSKLNEESESEDNLSINSDEIDVSYVTGHNKNNGDVNKMFEDYMKAREKDDDFYNAREMTDSNAWKDVLENPLNISASMGKVIGKDLKLIDSKKRNNKINKSTIDAYKQLMSER